MVYKKYIRREGKVFGPYYYHNRKVDGKVVTDYIGKEKDVGEEKSFISDFKKSNLLLILGFIFLVVFGAIFLNFFSTGKAVLNMDEVYYSGESLEGNVNLVLSEKELIPADSNINIFFNDETYSYTLRELAQSSEKIIDGEFYIENYNISGSGEGYGFSVVEEIEETQEDSVDDEKITFVLEIYEDVETEEVESGNEFF